MHLLGFVESTEHVCCRYRLAAFEPALVAAGHTLTLADWPRHWWDWPRLHRQLSQVDGVIVQRRLLSAWQRFWLRRSARGVLFDFDDAVWLRDSYARRGPHSLRRLRRFRATLQACSGVIAGNAYLAAEAQRWVPGDQVAVIPTCVDPSGYPLSRHTGESPVRLVWIGSSSTLKGLERIRDLLERIGRNVSGLRLRLICDRFLDLADLPVEACPWEAAHEAQQLASADIGLAWLPDDDWSRGKCGLKVLQYMAAGLPVVANPVGVQRDLVVHGQTGFLAETPDEWIDAIRTLAADPELRKNMGKTGQKRVLQGYSVARGGQLWCDFLARWQPKPGLHWSLTPAGEAAFGPQGPDPNRWFTAGQAEIVKHGPHRTVYKVTLPGLVVYWKRCRLAGLRSWFRQLVRRPKAQMEYARAGQLRQLGIATFEALGWGVARKHYPCESSLLTRQLEQTMPLGQYLESVLPQESPRLQTLRRHQLAKALGQYFGHLHEHGVTHPDPHPGNLLIDLQCLAPMPRFYLLDLHSIGFGKPLSWKAVQTNLSILNRWFLMRASRTDRFRFWRSYCQQRGWSYAPDQVRLIEQATWNSNRRFWRSRDRRCWGNNRYFHKLRSQLAVGHAVDDLDATIQTTLLANPDHPMENGATVLKQSRSSTVVEWTVPTPTGRQTWIYKRFSLRSSSDPWRNLIRLSPALRSWMLGHALRDRWLPTPRPLLVLHRRKGCRPGTGYLLAEKIQDARDLHQLAGELATLADPQRQQALIVVIEALARLIRKMHQRPVTHRDLKASNLLVTGNPAEGDCQIHLIDLVGARLPGRASRARRLRDLTRLHASFHHHPLLSRTVKLRFLQMYRNWALHGSAGWKQWWRELDRRTRAKIAKNQARGRPLG